MTKAEANKISTDEAAIRALIESGNQAHHRRDAAAIAAPYAKDARIFDLAPPLSHHGLDRKELEAWLDTWVGPVDRDSRDFDIAISGDLAFGHGFYRISAESKAGGHAVFWFRATLCLQRSAGEWRIVHEHTSVPFRMDGSFLAATDLEP